MKHNTADGLFAKPSPFTIAINIDKSSATSHGGINMPYLIMCKDSKDYRVFRFSNVVKIGRAESNDIVLNDLNDLAISRHHAYIEQREGRDILFDQSANGTFVDDERIERYPLSHGTVFRVLDYLFTYVEDSAAESIDQKAGDGQELSIKDQDSQAVETLVPIGDKRGDEADEKTALKNRLLQEGIIVESEKMVALYQDVQAVAGINVPVLILGEPGTGKEHVARALHNFSKVSGGFVPLNCSSVPEGIFESELFGSVRGAFHNATNKPGKLELANGGTIFLDEIGDMSLSLQPKLLRFIEDKKITRLGDTKIRKLAVRVVAATNQDLKTMMQEKTFREDFYHRLACIKLKIPPLRERKEDILPLTEFFLSKFSNEHNWRVPRISDNGMKMLMEYHWPGNIRELRNVLFNVLVHVRGKTIYPRDFAVASEEMRAIATQSTKSLISMNDMQKRHIIDALERAGWNKAKASKLLGISRDTLYRKLQKYRISSK
jgi:DNA-binding NtrC family response regulator